MQARGGAVIPDGNDDVLVRTAYWVKDNISNQRFLRDAGLALAAAHEESLEAAYQCADRMSEPHLGAAVACKPGCNACCVQIVVATQQSHAKAIVAHLESEPILKEKVVARLKTMAYAPELQRCPLLADDGLCSVYALRPINCRSTYSQSRQLCEDIHLGGSFARMNELAIIPKVDAIALAFHDVALTHSYENGNSMESVVLHQYLMERLLNG